MPRRRRDATARLAAPAADLEPVADGVRLLFVQSLARRCGIRTGNWQDDAFRTALVPFNAARSAAQVTPMAPRERRRRLWRINGAERMALAAGHRVQAADPRRACTAVQTWPEFWRLDAGAEERRGLRQESVAATALIR